MSIAKHIKKYKATKWVRKEWGKIVQEQKQAKNNKDAWGCTRQPWLTLDEVSKRKVNCACAKYKGRCWIIFAETSPTHLKSNFVQAQVYSKVLRCLRASWVILTPRQSKPEGPLYYKKSVSSPAIENKSYKTPVRWRFISSHRFMASRTMNGVNSSLQRSQSTNRARNKSERIQDLPPEISSPTDGEGTIANQSFYSQLKQCSTHVKRKRLSWHAYVAASVRYISYISIWLSLQQLSHPRDQCLTITFWTHCLNDLWYVATIPAVRAI